VPDLVRVGAIHVLARRIDPARSTLVDDLLPGGVPALPGDDDVSLKDVDKTGDVAVRQGLSGREANLCERNVRDATERRPCGHGTELLIAPDPYVLGLLKGGRADARWEDRVERRALDARCADN